MQIKLNVFYYIYGSQNMKIKYHLYDFYDICVLFKDVMKVDCAHYRQL